MKNDSCGDSPTSKREFVDAVLLELDAKDASAAELRQLNELLLSDEALRKYALNRLHEVTQIRSDLQYLVALELYEEQSHVNRKPATLNLKSEKNLLRELREAEESRFPTSGLPLADLMARGSRRFTDWARVCVAMLIGGAITLLAIRITDSGLEGPERPSEAAGGGPRGSQLVYVAHVVQDSGNIWSTTDSRQIEAGAGLRGGDAIRLTEGIGQVLVNGVLELSIEGPAELEFQSDGVPFLRYGKICVQSSWGSETRQLNTPYGTLVVADDSAIGIALYGRDLQIHAFRGQAHLDVSSAEDLSHPGLPHEPVYVKEQEAKHISVTYAGAVRINNVVLAPNRFADRVSMAWDKLQISNDYVQSVLDLQPVAYWRFEAVANGVVANEVSDRYDCQLLDGATLVEQTKNHVLELGFGSRSGSAYVPEEIEELVGDSYALECWVKSSHFHQAALLSFMKESTSSEGALHGLLLGLRGQFFYSGRDNNSVRFLHRPTLGASGGTDLFSSINYPIRRWQHIVVTKQNESIRMYIDAKQVASDTDAETLESALSLVIGKLYSFDAVRPFVGQIDEVAVYGHAITQSDVERHHQLARESSLSILE